MDISCQEARLLFKLREVRRLRGIYNTYKSLFCKDRTPEEQNFKEYENDYEDDEEDEFWVSPL